MPAIKSTPSSPSTLPTLTPQMMLGAASPLWALFAGATLSGMAFWWSARAFAPRNLEALLEAATAPAKTTVAPTLVALPKAISELKAEPVAAVVEATPVGGEAAPIGPALEAPAAAVVAAALPVEAAVAAVAEAAKPAAPRAPRKARPRKAAPKKS